MTEEYGHISDAFDNLPEEELLMTEEQQELYFSLRLMTEWFSDAYWHWRNVFYFRFSEYNDDIDRLAFFGELNYGWYQMYADEGFWC